jgi:hypothetical protein
VLKAGLPFPILCKREIPPLKSTKIVFHIQLFLWSTYLRSTRKKFVAYESQIGFTLSSKILEKNKKLFKVNCFHSSTMVLYELVSNKIPNSQGELVDIYKNKFE